LGSLARKAYDWASWWQLILDHYGHVCACCGEATEGFLTIDHIENDGSVHRAVIRQSLYPWLLKHNFPDGFQTLCYNCNCGKARNGGVCPHKQPRNE
jgi:hypothetical protein